MTTTATETRRQVAYVLGISLVASMGGLPETKGLALEEMETLWRKP